MYETENTTETGTEFIDTSRRYRVDRVKMHMANIDKNIETFRPIEFASSVTRIHDDCNYVLPSDR